ncbi:MAG: peptidase [Acidobacteria bacterium]|nr:peptidase [Acidobacteriota bacterium]
MSIKARRFSALLPAALVVVGLIVAPIAAPAATAQERVTTPLQEFGNSIGDDYFLANYQQLVAYWQKLEQESDRMTLEVIGETEQGRPIYMAIITSPENHRNLDRYKEISARMAHAEGVDEAEARALAAEGKSVVWIDGGLHATEVLGAQQLIELVYQMNAREDPETLRFLDDVILLATCVNPDGMDLVTDWYMRNPVPEERSTRGIPVLYQEYAGHDNNRDFYMSTQSETIAINNILYREWFPQIVYNHHQRGPSGTVLFAPPFRGPFNYNIDPLLILGIDTVGTAMHSRFLRENKPGATMRSGASYSTWWNGGLRTTPYWHNQIGLLTETIGNPTPTSIPFSLARQLPSNDLPYPIAPQEWHFRQSIEYSMTANRAVLDIASKLREDFLFNIWRMGMNSIERGNRNHWTLSPARIAAVEQAMAAAPPNEARAARGNFGGGRGGGDPDPMDFYESDFRDLEARDPRGYILPADQVDFSTATKFVNTLIKSGVTVHRATSGFTAAGRSYPAGSYVVLSAQAFRPFVLDMFEPQVHPDDFAYPGAPPTPPYDVAGWTVAYQMGVEFDRILDRFDGPFERLPDLANHPAGTVTNASGAAGYLFSPEVNDSFNAVNKLLAAGDSVFRYGGAVRAGDAEFPAGAFYVTAGSGTVARLSTIAEEIGVSFVGASSQPSGDIRALEPMHVGLWDRYGGDMSSGWTRWLFEQFDFDFEVVFTPDLDAGDLKSKYDVLVFMSAAIPGAVGGGEDRGGGRGGGGIDDAELPAEFRGRQGTISSDRTIPLLREFVENGGTIIAVGNSAMNLAAHFELPVENHLVERSPTGAARNLGSDKFYVPGSILEVNVDNDHPLAWGMGETANLFFRNSPVFRLRPNAAAQGVEPVAWFGPNSLRSGWAWGQTFREDGVAVVAAKVGNGNVFLFGPEINFRAQPHGTFKLLFNGIYADTESASGR